MQALVTHHRAPERFAASGAGPKAYKRLVRALTAGGTCARTLEGVARAAHEGRTGNAAFAAGDAFLARALAPDVVRDAATDVVQGRHLIARGLTPGPAFKAILARCRDVQDETGWTDPEQIMGRAGVQR